MLSFGSDQVHKIVYKAIGHTERNLKDFVRGISADQQLSKWSNQTDFYLRTESVCVENIGSSQRLFFAEFGNPFDYSVLRASEP